MTIFLLVLSLPLSPHVYPLPGVTGPAGIDLIAYEREPSRVWIPMSATGSVVVYDVATHKLTRIDGFKTEAREVNGKTRIAGPNAAAVGEGQVYVTNRATHEVCAVASKTLTLGACVKLAGNKYSYLRVKRCTTTLHFSNWTAGVPANRVGGG